MNSLLYAFLVICCIQSAAFGRSERDYSKYFDRIVEIETAISYEKFDEAVEMYANLFTAYNALASDAYNACQIAAMTKSTHCKTFLSLCAKTGIEKNTLMRTRIRSLYAADSVSCASILSKGYAEYWARIDTNLRNEFKKRFETEQNAKGQPNYKTICYDNFNRILALAEQGRFPDERVIGITAEIENSYVFATLKHYPYAYLRLKEYLWESVRNGGTKPMAVLYLYSFNQTRTSVLYTNDIPRDTANFTACYNIAFGKRSDNLDAVNEQRKQRGVLPVQTETRLEDVCRKYRIDFKQGY